MTTKFAIGIVFRKAEVSAKFHCATSTGENPLLPSHRKPKEPTNSGGTIVYNYPYYVRRRGWMPRGLLLFIHWKAATFDKKVGTMNDSDKRGG